jgi:hypothetical protein
VPSAKIAAPHTAIVNVLRLSATWRRTICAPRRTIAPLTPSTGASREAATSDMFAILPVAAPSAQEIRPEDGTRDNLAVWKPLTSACCS